VKRFVLSAMAAVALLFSATPAFAQNNAGEAFNGITPCVINSAAPIVCPAKSVLGGVLLGVVNNSFNATTTTVTCYSNSTGAASGPKILELPLLGPLQILFWPAQGQSFPLQMVCQASGTPSSDGGETGIDIYVY
jgi:hypothetical protein